MQTEFNERFARLSPNRRWLAYTSDETKRCEIYVQTFSGAPPGPGGRWQVSTNGGNFPVWSQDGKELFFLSADRKWMVVDIKGGAKFEAGVPQPLFETRIAAGTVHFNVGKNGRFLIPTQTEHAASGPMNVVVNWTAGLKK